MLRPRLIAVLLLKDGVLVRSQKFSMHQSTGDPVGQVERFTAWKADEIIYLDISRSQKSNHLSVFNIVGSTTSRKDIPAACATSFDDVVRCVSPQCMVPLTVGGKIRSLDDIRKYLKCGADKISINTHALREPGFIDEAARVYGNQCIVVSVDVIRDPDTGRPEVVTDFGKTRTGRDPVEWCREVQERGGGEILLNSVDRDGVANGYDIELLQSVSDAVHIPVIALGGVGTFDHLVEGLKESNVSAVAAANIFHFTELSIINAKKHMADAGIPVRL